MQITHKQNRQIVTREELRRILRASGERCYCAPDTRTEWDAGRCPQHQRATAQTGPRDRGECPGVDPDELAGETAQCSIDPVSLTNEETGRGTYHQPAIGDHDPSCRLVTGRVNSSYCEDCRRRDRLFASGEPFCTCGYIVSRCVGSRRGCGKGPSIDRVPDQRGGAAMTAIGLPARAPCDRCGGDHLECHAPVLNDRELCEGAEGILAKARAIVTHAQAGEHDHLRRALLDLEEDAGSLALAIPR